MSEAGHLLEIRDLTVSFGDAPPAVDGVSLHLDAGETLAILGESGSGKSVSSSTVLGLIDTPPARISAGSLFYRGNDLGAMPAAARRALNGRRIAMIFQDPLAHLNPVYSVGWQIAEALRVYGGQSRRQAEARAVELMQRVGLPDPAGAARRYPHEFSGGQRQRIMIAMALALGPEILIADEPTTALDVTIQAEILALIKSLQAEDGMALILITHDLNVAAHMADRVAVMYQGRIVETGPVREVLTHPRHDYTRALLAAAPGLRASPARPQPLGNVILKVKDLSKTYTVSRGLFGKPALIAAVRGVSFDLRRGETLGIVGESGSGKSSIARLLMRIGEPTSGHAEFHGRDLFALRGRELFALRRRVQMVFQDPNSSLNPRMSVQSIISEPWAIHPEILPGERWRARVQELLQLVGLEPEHADRYPHEFSGGQRQRIAIARALAAEPEIIICDEAVSALDVSVQAQVIALLNDIQRRLGVAYIFISHDLEVVREIADRVVVMKSGEVVEEGPTERLFREPHHAYTRALLAATLHAPWLQEAPAAAPKSLSPTDI